MPLKLSTAVALAQADGYDITAFSVDITNKVIQVVYDIKLGTQVVRAGVSGRVDDPTLITPLFTKHYSTIKADIYKLCQDAGVFPTGGTVA